MTKILVTGANGQLGSEIKEISKLYNHKFVFTNKDVLDITDISVLNKFFKDKKINYIINCTAYTAVDKAEYNRTTAMVLNRNVAKNLAIMSKRYDARLVQISTDFVFDGIKNTPYYEEDTPNPISVYGKTKYEGEKAVLEYADNTVIIRTSWLYSSHGQNFVKTIIKNASEKDSLRVVYDQIGTPTYAADLAKAIMDILLNIDYAKKGIYYYSNEGVASWYDFAKTIVDLAGIKCKIEPIETKDYPTLAKRPSYSVLSKAKIKRDFNIKINHWFDSLKKCMELMC